MFHTTKMSRKLGKEMDELISYNSSFLQAIRQENLIE